MADTHLDPAIQSAGSAIIAAGLTWLGHRLVGKAAIQSAINAGFKEIMDQMRQELRAALRERDEARGNLSELEAHIEELKRTIAALELRVSYAERDMAADAILRAEG